MDQQLRMILGKTREMCFHHKMRNMTLDSIAEHLGIPKSVLMSYVKTKGELIRKALEFERNSFKVIFDTNDFEGVNAIDILFTVSRELSSRFDDINPTLTADLRNNFPAVYRQHIEDKYDFIFGKIKINIHKGISQGMYRDDLSIELVARLYLARLMDIHNPLFFPPEQFSFDVLFNYTIENFVRSIANEEGLKYYESRKKCFNPKQPK
jgi:AcrR family transcriptional regulator